ncbi:MAG: DUF2066 domain-containing protein [Gammaproteobacteria bacterium]|nr:DUF2066 domain-containing protein [Gammaproteobacteria bacterium]
MKKTYASIVIFIVLMISLWRVVQAVTDPSPYRAQLPIISAESQPSNEELKMALAQVLSKLTNLSDIDKNPAWADSLNHAKDWMLSYQYIAANGTNPLTLEIDFDPNAVSQLLKSKGKPVPSPIVLPQQLLVWLAVDNGDTQNLIGNGSSLPYLKTINDQATQKSINIEWPLLDLTDMNALTFEEVWSGDWSAIDTASKRYQHDGILLISLSKGAGDTALWTSDWTLKTARKNMSWTFTANNAETALNGGMAQLSLMMSKGAETSLPKEATKALPPGQVQVIVYGIGDLSAMDGLKSSLQALPPVQQVEVVELSPDEVIFNISCQGGSAALQQAIADQITTLVQLTQSVAANDTLTYQWAS